MGKWDNLVPVTEVAKDHGVDPGFLDNAWSSTKNFAGNMLAAASHPVDTATSIHDVVNGYIGKMRGQKAGDEGYNPDEQRMADAMTKHFKDRYGSVDAIKRTAYTDPVGFAADLSGVVAPLAGGAGLLGEAADAAGLARTANVLRTASKVGGVVAETANPLSAGKTAARITQGAGKVMSGAGIGVGSAVTNAGEVMEHPVINTGRALAKKLYRTALDPSGTAAEGSAKVDTLMNEGIGPTGEQPAWDKINQYSQQVKDMLSDPRAQGVTADPTNVLKGVDPLLAPQGKASWVDQLAPMGGPDKVQSVVDDFVQKHFNPGTPGTPAGQPTFSGVYDAQGNRVMTPGAAAVPPTPATPVPMDLPKLQGEKQNTYARLKDSDFGGGPSNTPMPAAERQAQVGLAKGARNEIGDKLASVGITGIHGVNAKEGGLLDAMPDLQRNAAKMASAGIFGSAKEALIRRVLPTAALQLYKAGKLPWETTEHILKQGALGAGIQEGVNAQ